MNRFLKPSTWVIAALFLGAVGVLCRINHLQDIERHFIILAGASTVSAMFLWFKECAARVAPKMTALQIVFIFAFILMAGVLFISGQLKVFAVKTKTIEILIKDAQTGKALADAAIFTEWSRGSGHNPQYESSFVARTDRNGRATVPSMAIRPPLWREDIFIVHPSYETVEASFSLNPDSNSGSPEGQAPGVTDALYGDSIRLFVTLRPLSTPGLWDKRTPYVRRRLGQWVYGIGRGERDCAEQAARFGEVGHGPERFDYFKWIRESDVPIDVEKIFDVWDAVGNSNGQCSGSELRAYQSFTGGSGSLKHWTDNAGQHHRSFSSSPKLTDMR